MIKLLCCLVPDPDSPFVPGVLEAVARACSPRVEPHGDAAVIFDAAGLSRAIGTPQDIAREVARLTADQGMVVRVAMAGTATTAWLLAHARPGVTVVTRDEAAALASVSLRWLAVLPEMAEAPDAPSRRRAPRASHFRMAPGPSTTGRAGSSASAAPREILSSKFLIATFERWGLRTLGDVARLPRSDVHARLGPAGVRLHQAACGEDAMPLVPAVEAVPFVERIALDWPIEGLEPLSFVLARACDGLSAALERADRGAIVVTLRLQLVTREMHERVLNLPAPMRDGRVIRTLLLLDLESHPPPAGIDVVEIELGVAPGRIIQGSLLARSLPTAEDIATLTARLGALMGESRIGAPALVDTHDDRVVGMQAFLVTSERKSPKTKTDVDSRATPIDQDGPPAHCLRRFRLPITARVQMEHGAPSRVVPAARGLAGGRVVACAGPWRTSGRWWALDRSGWDRDEWDVELADGGVYRLARHRATGQWELEGAVD